MAEAKSSLDSNQQVQWARNFRVLIDARKFCDGGIGVYIVNLVDGLLLNPENKLGLIIFEKDRELIEKRYAGNLERIKLYESGCLLYSLAENTALLHGIPQKEYDLFHSPHFTLPINLKIPSVVTVHDLIHILKPSGLGKPLAARILISLSMKRASRVLTVSHASAADIRKCFSWVPDLKSKLSVIHNSLPARVADYIESPEEYLHNRFRLQGSFLLTVLSNTKKHKGITDLLMAFNELKNISPLPPSDLKLVLAGYGSEKIIADKELFDLASQIEGVRLLGRVSEAELGYLYAGAEALVVPSFSEGFCLPALEAKAQGVTVIARPVPALREILGTNDIIAPDFEYSSLYAALESFFANPERKRRRNNSVLQNELANFSILENTKKICDIYNSICK